MEEFNDVTTNGSRDKCERVDDVIHPSWCSAFEDSKDEQEDEVECKKLTMVLTKVLPASMEGVGATKDSREQSIPYAVVSNDNNDEQDDVLKGLMMVLLKILTTTSSFFLALTFLHATIRKWVANDFRHLECQNVHYFTLLGIRALIMLHLRHIEGCCLLKLTSTLNLAVLVSCSLLAGGSRLRLKELSTKKQSPSLPWIGFWRQLDVQRVASATMPRECSLSWPWMPNPFPVDVFQVLPWSHTLALLVLEWRSLAISLLMLAMKFSICGGGILCLQQVGTSRNIPSKALLGSSCSIEGSWFFFGFLVSAATTSLRACWFLTMLSRRVEETTSWLLATSLFVLACPFFDE
ncbi:uncharacterized protein G2W53_042006 [Senna tora]|uniref:Uncharacterized protein n=1 Tax=Senna tora TaxID=362788 RepID=A0A834VZL6_9FABA|nr:uncharacterized protein G2W53_042006 [Senna tora]